MRPVSYPSAEVISFIEFEEDNAAVERDGVEDDGQAGTDIIRISA